MHSSPLPFLQLALITYMGLSASISPSTEMRTHIVEFLDTEDPVLYDSRSSFQISDGDHRPRCSIRVKKADFVAICSHQNRTEIPRNLPINITFLNLRDNLITEITDYYLSNYPSLRILDLSSNLITCLSEFSFQGLRLLEKLNLSQNNISLIPENFPINVFRPLKSLIDLRLQKNNADVTGHNLSYPDKALSELKSLSTLRMDGLRKPYFGPGFGKLRKLVNLSLKGYITGYCLIEALTNKTFQYLSSLEALDMTACYIRGECVEAGTFQPLSRLRRLDLTHNEDIGIEHLPTIFYDLQNATDLKEILLHLVVNRYSLSICLESKFLAYFPKSVEILDARENNIEAVDRSVIQLLANIKKINLNGNKFVFGTYLQDLPKFENLESLSLNGGGFTYTLPSIYPYQTWLSASHPPMHSPHSSCPRVKMYPHRAKLSASRHSMYSSSSSCSLYNRSADVSFTQFILKLPPKLKEIEMEYFGLTYKLSKLDVHPSNSLQKLSLAGNHFPELVGPINGLNATLEVINLSGCGIGYIKSTFFTSFPTLKTLRLDNNHLGEFFKHNGQSDVFSCLINLRSLNLSQNGITVLQPYIFKGLQSLEFLYLQYNPIVKFKVDISHMIQLKVLNLSYTSLSKLLYDTRRSIDLHLRKSKNISISLINSPIVCACNNLEFLRWMILCPAFPKNFTGYLCSLPDSTVREMKNGYNETVFLLNRECIQHHVLLLVVAICSAVVLVIIGMAICYRFRFKMLYFYYMAYLLHKKKRCAQRTTFMYDAFICYAKEDFDFVESQLEPALLNRGLHIFLHDRDFIAGEYINSNIVKAVSICKKTVVVVTKAMLKSNWCQFEVKMANLEATYTGRKVLIFLLMRTKPQRDENLEVFYHIQNNTYCIYPDNVPNDDHLSLMWNKLVRDIND